MYISYMSAKTNAKRRSYIIIACITLALYTSILCFFFYQADFYRSASTKLLKALESYTNDTANKVDLQQCELLQVNPYNKDVLPLLKEPTLVNCIQEFYKNKTFKKIAFKLKNGYYLHKLKDVGYPCCMAPFKLFYEDQTIKISRKCIPITENITQIPKNFEYIEIRCTDRNVLKYRDAFPVVHPIIPSNKTKTSNSKSHGHPKLNVMILVLESTSKQNFQRQMPQSSTYLSKILSAVPLELYNKIGYNTHPNMVALLTGQSIKQFSNNCLKSRPDKPAFLNDCPFIWKKFSERGYVTSFMEDCSLWPIFNHYWTDPFIASPTDYYYLPFAIRMDGLYPVKKRGQCHGPRLTFENMLKFGKMITEMAATANTSYFQLIYSSRQTYKNINSLKVLDTHLLRMLKQMKASKALNSTALFILGDHGYRFYANDYAQTLSGETEDKMPVGYVVLPKWFKRKYPTPFMNLVKNVKKRTTAFDIHATLNELIDLNDYTSKDGQGVSLFGNIPEDRTCLEAGIPLEWCLTCYPNVPLLVFENDQPSPMIMNVTKMFINSMNQLTKEHRDECLPLKLKSIENAWKWDPRDVYSELCGKPIQFQTQSNTAVKISCDGFLNAIEVVKVELITSPNNGTFEGEAIRLENGEWIMMENVMRVDAYYNQSSCMPNKEIKPYCFCDPKLRQSSLY